MSVRNKSTRVEEYYSDEDQYDGRGPPPSRQTPPTAVSPSPRRRQQQSSPKFRRNSMIAANVPNPSRLRNTFRGGYYPEQEEESVDEEDVARAMYELGLEDHNPYHGRLPPPRRFSFDYFDPPPIFSPSHHHYHHPVHSPGYFIPPPPPSRYMNREDDMGDFGPYSPLPHQYMIPPHHLQDRYGHPPPPPPQWVQQQMMDDIPPHMRPDSDLRMYSPQHQQPNMDLPFVRRSASSRSHNNRRNNRPNQRVPPSRRNQEFFMPHDDDGDNRPPSEELVNNQQDYLFEQQRAPLSRQSSIGSNASTRKSHGSSVRRNRRSNSLSDNAPPIMMIDDPHNTNYFAPMNQHSNGRRIHSEPNSPQHLSSESSDDDDAYYAQQQPQRRIRGSQRQQDAPSLGRSISFQGFPPPHMAHPPAPIVPQQAPQMILHPSLISHPNTMMENTLRRNMFVDPMLSPSLQPVAGSTTAPISGDQQPQQNNMMPPPVPHWMGLAPPPPGNVMFNQPHMLPPAMGLSMFNNPMMAGPPPPPPQQPMWNFMNPQDMWFGDFPLPFMNSSDPNLISQTLGGGGPPQDSSSPPPPREVEKPPKEAETTMPPPLPQEQPMLRRGLSLLGGLFGGGAAKGPPPPPAPFLPYGGEESGGGLNNFSVPIQGGMFPQTKKEMKLAQQYQKLGSIWCWRQLDAGEDGHFESFSISNQKIIKRKGEKAESRNRIMLGREKKLPGEIMVDLNQFRGCCMMTINGKSHFFQLEIKQEPFEGNNSFVFANSMNQSGRNW